MERQPIENLTHCASTIGQPIAFHDTPVTVDFAAFLALVGFEEHRTPNLTANQLALRGRVSPHKPLEKLGSMFLGKWLLKRVGHTEKMIIPSPSGHFSVKFQNKKIYPSLNRESRGRVWSQ